MTNIVINIKPYVDDTLREVIETEVCKIISTISKGKTLSAIAATVAGWLIDERIENERLKREIIDLRCAVACYRKIDEPIPLRKHDTGTASKGR